MNSATGDREVYVGPDGPASYPHGGVVESHRDIRPSWLAHQRSLPGASPPRILGGERI